MQFIDDILETIDSKILTYDGIVNDLPEDSTERDKAYIMGKRVSLIDLRYLIRTGYDEKIRRNK